MDHFGISQDTSEYVLARDLEVPLQPGDVVLFTGASGSGKSSLLRVLRDKCQGTNAKPEGSPPGPSRLLDLPSLPLGTQTLVDAIPLPFEEALQLLAMCGLGEAPLLLRTPPELSEGQRYRFSIALAVALKPQWIVADEFAAVLDRTTAQVIAYNVRRIANQYGVGFLLATAQDDITADLSPDLCVTCGLDGRVIVTRSPEGADRNVCPNASASPFSSGEGLGARIEQTDSVPPPSNTEPGRADGPVPPSILNASLSTPRTPRKKKAPPSASTATSGSASPPVATGRISLGGIIAVTTSG